MDEMVYHKACFKGCKTAFVVGICPSCHTRPGYCGIHHKRRQTRQGKAEQPQQPKAASEKPFPQYQKAGILVQAHIGLTPQSVHQMGGYRIQRDEDRLLEDAFKVQQAGASSVVLEGVPASIAETISAKLYIPTIGIEQDRAAMDRSL